MPIYQAALAKEVIGLYDRQDRLFAVLGYYRYFDLTFMNIKDRISRISLREDSLPVTEVVDKTSEFSQEGTRRERNGLFARHSCSLTLAGGPTRCCRLHGWLHPARSHAFPQD